VINLAGTLLLYRAFTIGTLAIVAPVTSGFAVVTALLALLSGERPAVPALVGALLLVVGVSIAARHQHAPDPADEQPAKSPKAGLPEALGVTLCFGIYFWALDFVNPSLGIIWPVLISRAVALAGGLPLLLLGRGTAPVRLPRSLWGVALGAALLDTSAFLAFNLGISSEYTAIVTALASLFSAVTVLLAWAILRERLSPLQWAGVGVILAGELLVSLPDTLWAWAYGA
jgi:drug/metabolite transporter (DMT)-like permease